MLNWSLFKKKLESTKKILNTQKKHTKSKRIALENKFVFSTQKILNIAHATEAETKIKKKHKRPRKRAINEILNKKEIKVIETESQSSDPDCIVVARRM